MDGSFKNSLVHNLPDFENNALEKCREFSLKNIYKHPSVVKVELTGFNVIGDLLPIARSCKDALKRHVESQKEVFM